MKLLMTVLCWFIPFKRLRKRLKIKYVKSSPIKYTGGNRVVIHMPNGKKIINPYSIPDLVVKFHGQNNLIELFYPIIFIKSRFNLESDCKFTIHPSHQLKLTVDAYNNSTVFIGKNVEIGGAHIHMMNERFTKLCIGDNAVLSYDIEIYTTDTHPVLDMMGNVINNVQACVSIGEHSWIGASAVLLKGAQIGKNSIVGHSAVVASKFATENVVIAGNPARITKENVSWRGGKID